MELQVDSERWQEKEKWEGTGLYIRAQLPDGKFETVEISHLTKKSLLEWLRGQGGDNRVAEDVVGILLGYGHLHD